MTTTTTIHPWMSNDPKPIMLLDVDGVLNAFHGNSADANWSVGYADPDSGRVYGWGSGGRKYRIMWDQTVVDRIKDINASGLARVIWHTTWGNGANGDLRELLGLDELEVSYHPSRWDMESYGPSWWKLRIVRWYKEHNPDRKVVWCDDELANNIDASTYAEENGVMWVGPDPLTGLTHDDLDKIEAYLAG